MLASERSATKCLSCSFSCCNPRAALRPALQAKSVEHAKALDEIVAAARDEISYERIRDKSGVDCWHANDVESEACGSSITRWVPECP
jgi:hypothetical protein